MKILSFLKVLSLILLLSSCQYHGSSETPSKLSMLKSGIDQLINDSTLSNAQVGIHIETAKEGTVLYSRNAGKLFIPASNQKLYSTAFGLELLGPDYTYKTHLYTDGQITDSVLNGNLFIEGKGDPTISGRFYDEDIYTIFRAWADTLKNMGIKKITGKIIGIDTFFSGDPLGEGWSWDDQTYWYAAPIGALTFNDNCVDMAFVAGDSIGARIWVFKKDSAAYVSVINNAKTVHSDSAQDLSYYRHPGTNTIEINGFMPLNSDTVRRSLSINEPTKWFTESLKSIVDEAGIEIADTLALTASTTEIVRDTLLVHQSQPLSELIKIINKDSHNLHAEMLLKTVSAEVNGIGSAEDGSKVLHDWLLQKGVPKNLIIPVDGSGLSRLNLISPFATKQLLKTMYNSKNYHYYYESLPIAGVDGTLKRRMRGTVAEGVVRAKTGFVRYTRSLSGYTTDRAGIDYIFVMMFNNYSIPTSKINEIQNKIAVLLTNYNNL